MEALLLCCLHQFGSPPFQGSVWGRHVLTRRWKFPGNVLGTEWYCPKTLWPKLGFLLHILFLVGTPYDDIDHKTLTFVCGCQAPKFIFKPRSNQRPVLSLTHWFWFLSNRTSWDYWIGVLCLSTTKLLSDIEDNWRIWPSLLAIDLSPLVFVVSSWLCSGRCLCLSHSFWH